MVKESEIIFVTTSISTKWINYQQKILKDNFPESSFLVVDGTDRWPNAWFKWIDKIKNLQAKWYVHIDEDCFIENKGEVIQAYPENGRRRHRNFCDFRSILSF